MKINLLPTKSDEQLETTRVPVEDNSDSENQCLLEHKQASSSTQNLNQNTRQYVKCERKSLIEGSRRLCRSCNDLLKHSASDGSSSASGSSQDNSLRAIEGVGVIHANLSPTNVSHHSCIDVDSPTKNVNEPYLSELAKTFIAIQQHQSSASCEVSQSSTSVICRICHSADEELIAPCNCAGSSKYVHADCLVTWFKKSVKNQCELCMSDVKIRKINHSLSLWKKPEERPVPLIWFSVFFVGLFLNILSIYVNASEFCKSTACLIFYAVNGFGIILDAAFLWFWFLKCRHYWKKWCALNQDWFIDSINAPLRVEFVRSGVENV